MLRVFGPPIGRPEIFEPRDVWLVFFVLPAARIVLSAHPARRAGMRNPVGWTSQGVSHVPFCSYLLDSRHSVENRTDWRMFFGVPTVTPDSSAVRAGKSEFSAPVSESSVRRDLVWTHRTCTLAVWEDTDTQDPPTGADVPGCGTERVG